jgi:P27 family predicted phage terminase small subunit
LDVAVLASYCASYSRWRTAEEVLARMAERDELTRGLMIKSVDGNPRRNPLVKIAADAADAMIAAAGLFGMTPVARSRLAGGVYGQPSGPSKFDGLLG